MLQFSAVDGQTDGRKYVRRQDEKTRTDRQRMGNVNEAQKMRRNHGSVEEVKAQERSAQLRFPSRADCLHQNTASPVGAVGPGTPARFSPTSPRLHKISY